MRKSIVVVICTLLLALPLSAQDSAPDFETVTLAADDGLTLSADYYLPDMMDDPAPAVILLHMLNSERSAYEPLIPYLLEGGYAVLNVDMRGHGATGGSREWELTIDDTLAWFTWLREQDGVDASRTAIIGASIGGNVALLSCDRDADCVTAVALSPGENYQGVMPGAALENGLDALLIASHADRGSADSVRAFFANATGYVSARMYPGRAHGTRLFNDDLDSVAGAIIGWVDEQLEDLTD